jgi:hypothetical protein
MAAATHLSVVRVCRIAIASSTATAAQKRATKTIFATARAWISSARIVVTLERDRDGKSQSRLLPAPRLRYSPLTSMTHRLNSLALLLLLPLRGE